MRICVTGISGFIGRALLNTLLADGHEVIGLSRQREHSDNPSFEWRRWELGEQESPVSSADSVDVIVHLAALVHGRDKAVRDPTSMHAFYNHEACARLASQAQASGVKRFVFLSTIGVHGRLSETPVSRTGPVNPDNAYAGAKSAAERTLSEMTVSAGMDHVIIRPPLVYGPGVPANFLALMKLVRSGLPIPLSGVANARSMVYVDNLCDLILRAVQAPEAANRVYLASDLTLSTPDLIRRIAYCMDRPARLMPMPVGLLRLGGRLMGRSDMVTSLTESLVVDDSDTRAELGWQPRIDPEVGLQRTVEWFLGTGG